MMRLPVHRIIPFSNVEGMGNRTSIFVQGCNANCLYCHNAETIPMTSEAVRLYTVEELLEVIKGSMPFIRGITVSGGEATLYHGFLVALFEEVHKLGLTCYVDTNGFFDFEKKQALVQATDKFLYDVKGMGASLERLCFSPDFLDNDHREKDFVGRFVQDVDHFKTLERLLAMNKVEEVRLVYVKGFYEEVAVLAALADVLAPYQAVPLKLIKMHARGLSKERLKALKGSIPPLEDFRKLSAMARDMGLSNIIEIQ